MIDNNTNNSDVLAKQLQNTNDIGKVMELVGDRMVKNTQTTTTAKEIVEIDYDPEIKTRLVQEAPFLRFLEEKGRADTSESSTIGWRKKDVRNKTSIIAETDPIPEYGGKGWDKETEIMRTFVYPISVSMMAQLGINVVDLIDDDVQDGFADISSRKDEEFLLGDNSTNPHVFNGINKRAETKDDLKGSPISMDIVDDTIDETIAKGGTPDCIVTTARMARSLTREQAENHVHVNTNEFIPSHWVNAYHTPVGDIPVITDRNLSIYKPDGSVDPSAHDILAIVDSNAVASRTLLPITEFPLAMTKAVEESMLLHFTTFGISAPQKLGVLQNCGKYEPKKDSQKK